MDTPLSRIHERDKTLDFLYKIEICCVNAQFTTKISMNTLCSQMSVFTITCLGDLQYVVTHNTYIKPYGTFLKSLITFSSA